VDRLPQSAEMAARRIGMILTNRMELPLSTPYVATVLLDDALVPAVKALLYDRGFVSWLLNSGILPRTVKDVLLAECLCARCQWAPRLDNNALCLTCLEEDDREV
jgi:hypothetical protein